MNSAEVILSVVILIWLGAFFFLGLYLGTKSDDKMKDTLNPLNFIKPESNDDKIKKLLITIFGWIMIIGAIYILFIEFVLGFINKF